NGQRILTIPLLQLSVIRSRGQGLGSSTSLRYFLSPDSAARVRTSSWTSSLTSAAPTPGNSATISTWSASSSTTTAGSGTSATTTPCLAWRSSLMLPNGSTFISSPPSPTLTLNPYIPLNSLFEPDSGSEAAANSPLRDRVRPVSANADSLSSTSASPPRKP